MLTGRPTAAARRLDDREHAAELLGVVDRIGTGAGGLAADVEQVGAGGDQGEPVGDRGVGVEEAPAVGERVGRDVHDAHHRAAAPPRRPPTTRTFGQDIGGSA